MAGAVAGAFGGIWLAVVGFFVVVAARAEEKGLRVRIAFTGREAGRADVVSGGQRFRPR